MNNFAFIWFYTWKLRYMVQMLNNIFIFTYTQIKNKQIKCKEEGFKFVNNIDT